MAVALVGAVGTATEVTSGTSITGTYGQSPTAGNLLVAVVTRVGSGTGAPSVTGATGWTRLLPANYVSNIGVGSATACNCLADVWWKAAAGGDAQPSFTLSGAGGTTTFEISCTIYELSGANTSTPLDVSGTQSSGGTSATITTVTTTTSANVTASGEFAISVATRERTAGAPTITYSASWTNGFNDGATSQVGHAGVAHLAAPASGATASDVTSFSGTGTTAFSAGAVVVIAAAAVAVAGSPPGGLVVHRRLEGGLWGGAGQAGTNAAAVAVSGTPPRHLVIRRRCAARGTWQGLAAPPVPALARTGGLVRGRAAARAVWRGFVSSTANAAATPIGTAVLQAGGSIIHRRPVGGLWGGAGQAGANAAAPLGTAGTAPRHLVVRRRRASRAFWAGTVSATSNNTTVTQVTAFLSWRSPRPVTRAVARGQSAPPVLPLARTGGLLRRRTVARAVVRGSVSSTVNAAPSVPVNGTAPDHLVVARRQASRAVWRGTVSATVNNTGRRTITVLAWRPRPAPKRAAWAGTIVRTVNAAPAVPVNGTAPGHLVVARRAPSRAVWKGTVSRTVNAVPAGGTAPDHLVVARRLAARGYWRGNAVPAATRPPVTGGLVRRRRPARARARWTPVATTNAPPPAFQVARSTPSVTAPDTSAASVADPRDGSNMVAALVTSSPGVT